MSFLYSSTRNDMLQCFVCSPIPKVSKKKWATGQSFIRKEITSYRIGTLVESLTNNITYYITLYQCNLFLIRRLFLRSLRLLGQNLIES